MAGLTEVDHETRSEEDERQSESQTSVLELLGDIDDDTEDGGPQTRADVVDLTDITSRTDRDVIDDHAEVIEVEIPAVVAEEENSRQGAGTQNRPVLEQTVLDEMRPGAVFLPQGKHEEQTEPDDDGGDKRSALVFGTPVGLEAEREEKENEGGHNDQRTDH